jgi:hypothetical protein
LHVAEVDQLLARVIQDIRMMNGEWIEPALDDLRKIDIQIEAGDALLDNVEFVLGQDVPFGFNFSCRRGTRCP